MQPTQPILIGFDGSDASAHAIEATAELFPGAATVVVHVSHVPTVYASGYAGAPALPPDVHDEVERAAEEQAKQTLHRGTELARGVGLDVEGIVCVTPTVPWRRLLGVAEDVRARAIVVGSRGHGELTALILGSTSRALAHHSHLPLLIVPPETKG